MQGCELVVDIVCINTHTCSQAIIGLMRTILGLYSPTTEFFSDMGTFVLILFVVSIHSHLSYVYVSHT